MPFKAVAAALLALVVSTAFASQTNSALTWNSSSVSPETGVVPVGVHGVTQVAAGQDHFLALKSDGTVVAWGGNDHGQSTVPSGLSGVISVAAGYYESAAVKSNGSVVYWGGGGSNSAGSPGTYSNAKAISFGEGFGLVLRTNGSVSHWGLNDRNQGNFPGMNDAVQVAAGLIIGAALKSDGTVVCWGGDIIEGDEVIEEGPRAPAGLAGVAQISCLTRSVYCLKTDGTVLVFGTSGSTVLGGLSNIAQIAVGYNNSYGLKTDGTLIRWSNSDTSGTPTVLSGPSGAGSIDAFFGNRLVANYALGLTHTVNPTSVNGGVGLTASGTITLSRAQESDLTIALTSSSTLLEPISSTITLPAGQTTASYTTAAAKETTAQTDVTLTAALTAYSLSEVAVCTVKIASLHVKSLQFEDATIQSGSGTHGTVKLNRAAPNTTYVQLLSNHASATVPLTVRVAKGTTTGIFDIGTSDLATKTIASISAKVSGTDAVAANLTLLPAPQIASIYFYKSPAFATASTKFFGLQQVKVVVNLKANQSSPSYSVALTHSGADALDLPSSISIAEGSKTGYAYFYTKDISTISTETVTASASSFSAIGKTLTITPLTPLSVSLTPASVEGGLDSTVRVTLSAAPSTDVTLSITVNNPALASPPATVTVPAGQSYIEFLLPTSFVSVDKTVGVRATRHGVTKSRTLTILKPVEPISIQIETDAAMMEELRIRVTLNRATQKDEAVSISCSRPGVLPNNLVVTALNGYDWALYPFMKPVVTEPTEVTFTATCNGKSTTLTYTFMP